MDIMGKISTALTDLSDRDLVTEVKRLAERECQATADLIASLAELDARRLYLGEGCSSLFTYCTQVLHLSEHAAYGRIEAARAARRFPLILDRLSDGAITLTAVGLLAPHFTADNHRELLDAARHKSKRDVEHLVARLHARPDVPSSVRKLPAPRRSDVADTRAVADDSSAAAAGPAAAVGPSAASTPATASALAVSPMPLPISVPAKRPAVIAPLAPERYKIQVTVGAETHAKLRRAQDLLRHCIPDGDPAKVIDRALTALLVELEKTRLAATNRPRGPRRTTRSRRAKSVGATCASSSSRRSEAAERSGPQARTDAGRSAPTRAPGTSRHVPAAIKRAVWARDRGRCAFVGTNGRCTERGFLQFHHLLPYAAGGATTVENLQLRCAAHNAHEAERYFGSRPPRSGRRKEGVLFGDGATRSGPS